MKEDVKIWRYMDLGKFISMLVNDALYFQCLNKLEDRYEGAPQKEFLTKILETMEEQFQRVSEIFPQFRADLREGVYKQLPKIRAMFGVNCWHKNENENYAMWKVFSADIAIESTRRNLEESILDMTNVIIDDVRYEDLVNDPVEKGHKRYMGFQKMNAYSYEKELRASLKLPIPGEGVLQKCNLDTLITAIHISPFAEPYIKANIQALIEKFNLKKPIIQSTLLQGPAYIPLP